MTEWVVVGLMSGTSVDGIDAAILKTDGITFKRLGRTGFFPYREKTRSEILRAVENPIKLMMDVKAKKRLEIAIANDHATAFKKLIDKIDFEPNLIGFHGQTIFHNPQGTPPQNGNFVNKKKFEEKKYKTIQLGDARRLANACGTDVVFDFRAKDIQAGGEGAPLAPIYHKAVFDDLGCDLPATIVNIGGVANVTWYDGGENLIGFDTGPGNALLDDYMRHFFGKDYDPGGELGLKGEPHELLVESWLDHRFFSLKWPKSLDRRTFHHCLTDSNFLRLDAPDALATLASFTAKSISLAIDALPKKPRYLFVSGGGCHNRMLTSLVELYTGIPLQLGSGWSNKLPTDMLEAELIAFLAARYLSGLPSSFPETTGCKHPVCVGRLMISEDSE